MRDRVKPALTRGVARSAGGRLGRLQENAYWAEPASRLVATEVGMKRRLAALGVSGMMLGALLGPASPAQASHCNTTIHEYQEWLACSWDHVSQCVRNIITGARCVDPG